MLDNVLVANEAVHEAKRSRKPTFLLKVDFEKAYDSVNWGFLFYMLRRLKFRERWIRWVKGCLSSASVSILVNGSPTEECRIKKGLRQWDPLAPFLFLIVREGLSGLIRQAVLNDKSSPFRFCGESGPEVSLLQFADDTIFIEQVSLQNIFTVKIVLRCFELCSGLKVNFYKSKISRVGFDIRELNNFYFLLHCQKLKLPFIYLGLPVGGIPRRLLFWDPVLNKLRK